MKNRDMKVSKDAGTTSKKIRKKVSTEVYTAWGRQMLLNKVSSDFEKNYFLLQSLTTTVLNMVWF